MIAKAFDAVTATDIEALKTNGVRESRTIDYKRDSYGWDEAGKHSLLADVSAFANAGGGDVVIGIDEAEGLPTSIDGVNLPDVDRELQRLESTIVTGIEPRVPGVRMKAITGFPSGPVLIIRTPQSFIAPHAVTKGSKSYQFFVRASTGNQRLDMTELRSAFAASETNATRLERFRTDRVVKIIGGETPVPLAYDSAFILHVLPLHPYRFAGYIDEQIARLLREHVGPLSGGGYNYRQNLDGFLTYDQEHKGAANYTQVFRSGAIEAVCTPAVFVDPNRRILRADLVAEVVYRYLPHYLQALDVILSVPFPVAVTATVTGARGAVLGATSSALRSYEPVDRDTLLLPSTIAETSGANAAALLRPIFDALWNAVGKSRCPLFTDDDRFSLRGSAV